jgi:hypothetical protein
MQEIDVRPAHGHDQHAGGERDEIEGGERGVFFQFGRARDDARADRDREARHDPADRHGKEIEAGDEKAERGARQDRMRHGVARQAHPPQHQEHADGRRPERQRQHAHERAAHELELGEWQDEDVVHPLCQAA